VAVDNVSVEISIEEKAALQALTKLAKGVNQTSQQSVKQFGKMDVAVGSFAGTLAANLAGKALGAVTKGFQVLFNQFSQGVQLAQVQEDAINKLNAQLALTGDYSRETSQDLQAFASELQSVTKFGDEAILGQISFAQAMGASVEQSKAIVAVAADMSEALGMDLNSATRNVSKTLGGFGGELSEIIPELKDLSKEQLQAGAAIDLLGAKFRGQALAATQTFSGAVAQTSNIVGDTQETLSAFITQNPAVIAAIKAVGESFISLNGSLTENKNAINAFVTDFIQGGLIQGFEGIIEGALSIGDAFVAMKNSVNFAADVFLAFRQTMLEVELGINQSGESFRKFFNINVEGGKRVEASLNRQIEAIKQARMINDQEALERINAQDSIRESFKATTEAIKQSISERIAEQAKEREVQNQIVAGGAKEDPRIKQEQAVMAELALINEQKRLMEEEQQILKREQQGLINEEDLVRLREIEMRKAMIPFEQQLDANAKIKDLRKKDLADQKTIAQSEIAVLQKQSEIEKRINELRVRNRQRMVAGFGNALNQAALLAKKGSAEQKALAVASATINTYAASARAYRDYPFPANIAVMATTIAAGLAQVSNIKSQGFAAGGVIGGMTGASVGADNAIATVRQGEMVLNADQQRNLLDIATNGAQQGSNMNELVQSINNLASSPVVVNIENREVARAVRDARLEGFSV
jgi:hypothetical protein